MKFQERIALYTEAPPTWSKIKYGRVFRGNLMMRFVCRVFTCGIKG